MCLCALYLCFKICQCSGLVVILTLEIAVLKHVCVREYVRITKLARLTIISVSDTVLEHSVPLVLLRLCHHTEVVVTGVRVPEDQRELGGTL